VKIDAVKISRSPRAKWAGVLKAAAEAKGIEFGDFDLVVGKRDEMIRVDIDQKAAIEQLISNDHSAEFWATLSSLASRFDRPAR
jgi:hypothetical protein